MTEETIVETPETEMSEEATVPTADLKLNDIENAVRCIAIAQERGAYRVTEMSSVGFVVDRLTAFIKAVTPPEPEAATEEATEEVVETKKKNTRKKK